jgi:nicotinamide riboside transporter PnuC
LLRATGKESELISRRTGLTVLLVVTLGVIVVDLLLPRIPQPQSYHNFADQRSFMGIPNFGDVVSNVPFAIFGVMGLLFWWRLFRTRSHAETDTKHFLDPRERWPYLVVFVGVLLTAFGSAYYHLEPSNARLVWDRLPMTIAFMAVVAAIIAERISVRTGLWLLPLLVLIGMSSVLVWYRSELNGVGDLRFYATVQAYSVLFLFIALLLPPRYTRSSDLAIVAGFYALAKVLETYDKQIFAALGHIVSGHTLKHLAAAGAGYWILRMLQRRRPLPELSPGSSVA